MDPHNWIQTNTAANDMHVTVASDQRALPATCEAINAYGKHSYNFPTDYYSPDSTGWHPNLDFPIGSDKHGWAEEEALANPPYFPDKLEPSPWASSAEILAAVSG